MAYDYKEAETQWNRPTSFHIVSRCLLIINFKNICHLYLYNC